MDGAVVLETPRLSLRRFTADDVDLIVELDSDPDVVHFITGGVPTSRDEVVGVVLPEWLALYDTHVVYGFWAAEERGTGRFLGWFHLRPADGAPADEPELGYRLRRAAWGMGLATEGSRALIDLAFTRGGARRVVAKTMVVHAAARQSGLEIS